MKSFWIVLYEYANLVVSEFAFSVDICPLFELVGEANDSIDGYFVRCLIILSPKIHLTSGFMQQDIPMKFLKELDCQSLGNSVLRSRDNMAAIFQTTFPNVFAWMEMIV